MFDVEISLWFLVASLMLNLSPGPDLLFVMSNSVNHGWRAGIVATCGTCFAALLQVWVAGLGLLALLHQLPYLINIIQVIGAIYLIFLAYQLWFEQGTFQIATNSVTVRYGKVFCQGLWVDLFNPKVSLFFLAFLPQFIQPNLGTDTQQFLILGTLVVFISFVIESGAALMAHRLAPIFQNNMRLLNRALALCFVILAMRLV